MGGFCVSCPRTSIAINQCLGAVDQLRGRCDTLSSVDDNHCCQRQTCSCLNLHQLGTGFMHRLKPTKPTRTHKYRRKHTTSHVAFLLNQRLSSPPSPKRSALQEAFIPTSIQSNDFTIFNLLIKVRAQLCVDASL